MDERGRDGGQRVLDVHLLVPALTHAATIGGDLLSCMDGTSLNVGRDMLAAAPDLIDDYVHYLHFFFRINGDEEDCMAPGDKEAFTLHPDDVVNNLAVQRTTG